MRTTGEAQSRRPESLFEAELQYRPGMSAVTSPEGRLGELLGSGDGAVKGSRMNGTVHWDLYEKTEKSRCATNLTGVITADDGARIRFDTMGYGIVPDSSNRKKWSMAAALQFETDDKRYAWLNSVLAVWVGEFDMETYRHRYHAYSREVE